MENKNQTPSDQPNGADNKDVSAMNAGAGKREPGTAATIPSSDAPESAGQPKSKPHAFSNAVATYKNEKGEKLGVKPALIVRYLANRNREKGTRRPDGKRWFRVNIDHIAKQYPYLGRSTVAENLKRLEKFGLCEAQNLNQEHGRPKFDRTRWYHVPREFMDKAEQELRYFDPELAEKFGLPAAVVHYNFAKRLQALRKKADIECVDLRPNDLSQRLPFDHSTCKRAIKVLKDEKQIFPVPKRPGYYSEKPLDADGSIPDEKGSVPDKGGSIPDEKGSNPDNNIITKIDKLSLEECSKGKPPACVDTSSEQTQEFIALHSESATGVRDQPSVTPLSPSPGAVPQVSDPADNKPSSHSASYYFPEIVTTLSSYEDIVRSCRRINESLKSWNEEGKKAFVEKLSRIAMTFLRSQDEMDVLEWQRCRHVDDLYPLIAPHLWRFFDSQRPLDGPNDPVLAATLVATTHLILAGFFCRRRDSGIQPYPLRALSGLCGHEYEVLVQVLRITIPLKERLAAEELAARQREFASVDEDKEGLSHLSPAEKTRIFRNGVNSRNEVGWTHYSRGFVTNEINMTKGGLEEIERLFTLNRQLCPRELLRILDLAMAARMDASPPSSDYEGGVLWFARQGAGDVWKFARYLRGIVEELDYECNITFLGDAARREEGPKKFPKTKRAAAQHQQQPQPPVSAGIRSINPFDYLLKLVGANPEGNPAPDPASHE